MITMVLHQPYMTQWHSYLH